MEPSPNLQPTPPAAGEGPPQPASGQAPPQRRAGAGRSRAPYFILVLALVLTALVTGYVYATTEAHDRAEFRAATAQIEQDVELRLGTFVAMLRAGAGVFAAHPETSREDFRRFVEAFQLRERYPGIQGIGFARRYGPSNERELMRDLQRQGAASFRVWPPGGREGFAVAYIEPLDRRNIAALGFDMFSEPTRRAAMEQARDSGLPAASGPVELVQEIDPEKQMGFLVYVPVYRGGVDPGNVEARRAAIEGFVYAPFRADDLLAGILGAPGRVGVAVYDGRPPALGRALVRPAWGRAPRFSATADLDVAGRPWTLRFATLPSIDHAASRGLAPLIACTGVLISLLLFLATRAEAMARAAAEQSAAELAVAQADLAAALAREREARAEAERLFEAEAEARRSADVANRAKDEFLATLSHELRTPLTAVMGWVRLLRRGGLDEGAKARGIEVVERNVELQARLIDDLLDVSRIITGKLRLELRPIAVGPVVGAAVDVLRPTAVARGIDLVLTDEAGVAGVVGDPDRLQQVVWNLLSNALRFTPRGGRIDVSVRRAEEQIVITVADTGKGIAPDLLPYVFDRFRQGDGSIRRGYGGLGLGLAIVRHLVELHGGTAVAESEGEGKGATFRITLPMRAASAAARDGGAARGAAARPHPIEGLRVLVVDDEPDARELVGVVLAQGGAVVTTAASAQEALAEVDRSRPDVIVSDLAMPVEDGYALVRAVRARGDAARALPVVALTAHARDEDRRRALAAGFQEHVPKPIEPARLIAVVAALAGRAEPAGAAA
jgi:signal transduction histidine kinase/ActR/RegA family two-component response regulator